MLANMHVSLFRPPTAWVGEGVRTHAVHLVEDYAAHIDRIQERLARNGVGLGLRGWEEISVYAWVRADRIRYYNVLYQTVHVVGEGLVNDVSSGGHFYLSAEEDPFFCLTSDMRLFASSPVTLAWAREPERWTAALQPVLDGLASGMKLRWKEGGHKYEVDDVLEVTLEDGEWTRAWLNTWHDHLQVDRPLGLTPLGFAHRLLMEGHGWDVGRRSPEELRDALLACMVPRADDLYARREE